MAPTIPGTSDRERLSAHAEVLALQERLGLSYKDAAHRLYMAELERMKSDERMYKAFANLQAFTEYTLGSAYDQVRNIETSLTTDPGNSGSGAQRDSGIPGFSAFWEPAPSDTLCPFWESYAVSLLCSGNFIMGLCTGCAVLFCGLNGLLCMKCIKLAAAPSSTEREAIEKQPQCEQCSVVYLYMKNVLCGTCMDVPALSVRDANKTASDILSHAAKYQSTTSQHWLNQPPTLNAGLQAANAAQLKAKIFNLKKQVKGDTITMEVTLFYFPKSGAAARKLMLTVHTSPEIAHDQYNFQKTTITIDKHGNLNEVLSLDKKIKISKDWCSFCEGDKPEDGYLLKGATKFAFTCKARPGVDEMSNHANLMAEMKLLVHGQYFADSFAQHAQTYSVQIPDIHWNTHGAFIGAITNAYLDDTSSLVFQTFLAAPLLDMSSTLSMLRSSTSLVSGSTPPMSNSETSPYHSSDEHAGSLPLFFAFLAAMLPYVALTPTICYFIT
ncbi:hypothetical protein BYT27DRAFT_7251131 [Phlegmacium glaucopus]|nr:hypothetical protein BYT27DRAFT_7251131 [Phlegmacium glaucopus]